MIRIVRLLLILLLVSECFGCAHNSLTLTLDLYKEDPMLSTPLTHQEIVQLYENLDIYEKNTKTIKRRRTDSLIKLKNTFSNLSSISSNAKNEFNNFYSDYDTKLEDTSKRVFYNISSARLSLNQYTNKLYPPVIVKNTSAVSPSEVAVNYNTAKDSTLRILKMVLQASINSVKKGYAVFQDFPEELNNVSRKIRDELIESISEINKKHRKQFPEPHKSNYKKYFSHLKELDIYVTAIKILKDSDLTPDENNESTLVKLNDANLIFSQLDRLQNYADPVWREITSEENNNKWTTQFSKTHYFAEGRSEVFIVRDTPATYRVHQGSNNPTALVQSQLQISRALGNTALSIAAAASGVKLPFSLPGQTDIQNSAQPKDPTILKEATTSKVVTDANLTYGKKIAVYLKEELKQIQQEYPLSKFNDNDPKLDEFRYKFKSFLAAGKLLLQPNVDQATANTNINDSRGNDRPTPEPKQNSNNSSIKGKNTVTANILKVRTQPSESSNIIKRKKKGDKVTVFDEKAGWSKISPTDQEWVDNKYLKPNP